MTLPTRLVRWTLMTAAAWFGAFVWSGVIDNRRQGSPPASAVHELISFAPVAITLVVLGGLGVLGTRRSPQRRERGAFALLVVAAVSQLGAVAWETINRVSSTRGDAHEGLLVSGVSALIVAVVWLSILQRRAASVPPAEHDGRVDRYAPACYPLVFACFSLLALATLVTPPAVPNAVAGLLAVAVLLAWSARRLNRARGPAAPEPGRPADAITLAATGERQIARSWRLTLIAWRLLRRDATMLTLAAVSILETAAATFVLFWLSGLLEHRQRTAHLALVAALAAWPLAFFGAFLSVAIAAAASAAIDGTRLTLGQALAVSAGRVGQIALWSALVVGVGVVLRQIAGRVPFGGRLATWMLGAAWGLVTFFAVPLLALEDASAIGCVTRSASLMRRRWGEALGGTIAIGAWTVVALVPACVAIGAGLATAGPARIVLIAAAVPMLAVVGSFAGVTRQIYAVALYRYAAHDEITGGFDDRDLQQPFRPRRRWTRRRP